MSSADQAQCAEQELTKAEADLNEAFADALQQYSQTGSKTNDALPKSEAREQGQYEARMRNALIASQEIWLRYRTAACKCVAEMYDGGTITASAVPACQAALSRERAKFLRDYFSEK